MLYIQPTHNKYRTMSAYRSQVLHSHNHALCYVCIVVVYLENFRWIFHCCENIHTTFSKVVDAILKKKNTEHYITETPNTRNYFIDFIIFFSFLLLNAFSFCFIKSTIIIPTTYLLPTYIHYYYHDGRKTFFSENSKTLLLHILFFFFVCLFVCVVEQIAFYSHWAYFPENKYKYFFMCKKKDQGLL